MEYRDTETENISRQAKMCLCDLAGSEKMDTEMGHKGAHFHELKQGGNGLHFFIAQWFFFKKKSKKKKIKKNSINF